MAIFFVVKKDYGFFPVNDNDFEVSKKFVEGEVYRCEIKKPRNIKFHRKFFALLQYVFENQEKYDTAEDLRVEIELKSGSYAEHITTKGKLIYIPKSIAFEKMDNIEFEKLYNKAVDVILKDFIIGDTKENIEAQVQEILAFA